MLQTQFSFRGKLFRGNRIPESYENLQEAARKIMQVHKPDIRPEKLEQTIFNFEYELPGKHGGELWGKFNNVNIIRDDMSLMRAINMAF